MNSTIAIISDDILFWNLFIPLLDRKAPDLKINVCRNYQEINYVADQNNFSLIIIDGGIKNLSSIEIIQYIRSSKRILSPVWFFPEIKSDAYLHKSMLIGVNRIISKPFDPYVVVDEIISLLSLK
ncbi:MAG: response regulator [Paludibacter sp.]|nr:response regulator [Paludibacter sp.]